MTAMGIAPGVALGFAMGVATGVMFIKTTALPNIQSEEEFGHTRANEMTMRFLLFLRQPFLGAKWCDVEHPDIFGILWPKLNNVRISDALLLTLGQG